MVVVDDVDADNDDDEDVVEVLDEVLLATVPAEPALLALSFIIFFLLLSVAG